MTEELKAELETLKKGLEGKTVAEVKSAIEAFEAKAEKEMEAKLKGLVGEEVKTIKEQNEEAVKGLKEEFASQLKEAKESLETGYKSEIKVVQDHADKLDVRLGKKDIKKRSEKSFGEILSNEMLEKTDEIAKFQRKETKSVVIDLKAVGDMSTGNVTGGDRYGQNFNPQIIDRPSRKVYMNQILSGGAIGPGNSFTHMREVGVGEGNPAPVVEGALKEQFDFDLEESTVNIETIAGWLKVTRKAMSNIPGFVSFLQRRIPDRFMKVVDNQVLYGDGTTPNIKGLLTSGNFVASTSAIANPLVEKLIDDIAALEDTHERTASDILLRPVDYYSFFKNKASGSGEYDLPEGVTFEGGVLRLFGIPMRISTAINTPDYVVGDFVNGAQLLTQEDMRIEFFEQDGDNVRTNKVTIRVEGNYALPVYGPDYFIKGTTAQV